MPSTWSFVMKKTWWKIEYESRAKGALEVYALRAVVVRAEDTITALDFAREEFDLYGYEVRFPTEIINGTEQAILALEIPELPCLTILPSPTRVYYESTEGRGFFWLGGEEDEWWLINPAGTSASVWLIPGEE